MKSKGIKLDQKESTELTESKEFQPTPHMLVWLDTQVRTHSDVIDEIARESKVTEQAWYKWLKQDGFEDWYWAEYDKRTRRWKPTVDAIGLKFARRGSAEHFKYLAQRAGNTREDKGTTIPVQINNFLNKEKNEFNI